MERVARNHLDEFFVRMLPLHLQGFDLAKPVSWSGLSKGATFKRAARPKGPTVFAFLNYIPDRDRVMPLLAWSSNSKLPSLEADDRCAQLLRAGKSVGEVVRLPEGVLSATALDSSMPSLLEPPGGPLPPELQFRFVKDARVRGYLEAALGREIGSDVLPLQAGQTGASLFSYTLVSGLAPDVMTSDVLRLAYGNIIEGLERWMIRLQPVVQELVSNLGEANRR